MTKMKLRYMATFFDDNGLQIQGIVQTGEVTITPGEIVEEPTNPIWQRIGQQIAEDLYQQRQPLPAYDPSDPLKEFRK